MKTKTILIVILAVLVVALGVGAFYWYEYRPSQIRKMCTRNVAELGKTNHLPINDYQTVFKMCLNKYGLEK